MTEPSKTRGWPPQRVALVPGGRETARIRPGLPERADRKVRRYAKEETLPPMLPSQPQHEGCCQGSVSQKQAWL